MYSSTQRKPSKKTEATYDILNGLSKNLQKTKLQLGIFFFQWKETFCYGLNRHRTYKTSGYQRFTLVLGKFHTYPSIWFILDKGISWFILDLVDYLLVRVSSGLLVCKGIQLPNDLKGPTQHPDDQVTNRVVYSMVLYFQKILYFFIYHFIMYFFLIYHIQRESSLLNIFKNMHFNPHRTLQPWVCAQPQWFA